MEYMYGYSAHIITIELHFTVTGFVVFKLQFQERQNYDFVMPALLKMDRVFTVLLFLFNIYVLLF